MKGIQVSVYIDYQNVKLTKLEINNLLNYAKAKGSLVRKRVYYNSQCPDQLSVKKIFAHYGFDCIDVPCSLKNSADNQMVADCIQDVSQSPKILDISENEPETLMQQDADINCRRCLFIIVSGDGDFLGLSRILQELKNQVVIVARKGNVKQKLIESASEFHFIDKLPELLCSDVHDSSKMIYEEAIQCLLEAIKAATVNGKCPRFSLIDQLMRRSQKFTGYQGVSSIWTRDGKKFTCFKQFAESAAKDGLVGIKTQGKSQEFQLLESNFLAA
jgi:predicted nuclease of predicted toxin-antitoxin system